VDDQGRICRVEGGSGCSLKTSEAGGKHAMASEPDWTNSKRLFEQREQIAPRKLKQMELDQREQQLRRKGFIRMQIVSKTQKVSMRIQNPRHPMARRVGYINAGNALMGRIKGASKAQLGASSALRKIG
jgi:hypothetical protein